MGRDRTITLLSDKEVVVGFNIIQHAYAYVSTVLAVIATQVRLTICWYIDYILILVVVYLTL